MCVWGGGGGGNMDNISHRAVIRYISMKDLTPKEIHEDMVVKLGENAPSYSMVKTLAAEFKRDRDSLKDDLIREASQRHHTVDNCQDA